MKFFLPMKEVHIGFLNNSFSSCVDHYISSLGETEYNRNIRKILLTHSWGDNVRVSNSVQKQICSKCNLTCTLYVKAHIFNKDHYEISCFISDVQAITCEERIIKDIII